MSISIQTNPFKSASPEIQLLKGINTNNSKKIQKIIRENPSLINKYTLAIDHRKFSRASIPSMNSSRYYIVPLGYYKVSVLKHLKAIEILFKAGMRIERNLHVLYPFLKEDPNYTYTERFFEEGFRLLDDNFVEKILKENPSFWKAIKEKKKVHFLHQTIGKIGDQYRTSIFLYNLLLKYGVDLSLKNENNQTIFEALKKRIDRAERVYKEVEDSSFIFELSIRSCYKRKLALSELHALKTMWNLSVKRINNTKTILISEFEKHRLRDLVPIILEYIGLRGLPSTAIP